MTTAALILALVALLSAWGSIRCGAAICRHNAEAFDRLLEDRGLWMRRAYAHFEARRANLLRLVRWMEDREFITAQEAEEWRESARNAHVGSLDE